MKSQIFFLWTGSGQMWQQWLVSPPTQGAALSELSLTLRFSPVHTAPCCLLRSPHLLNDLLCSIIICSGAHWPGPLLFSPLTVIGVLSTFSFTSAMTGGETNSQRARLPAFPTHRDVRVTMLSLLSNNHKEGNVFTIWQISWCCGRPLAICHPPECSESKIGALQCRAADSRGQGRRFPSCRRASGTFLLPLFKAQCIFPDLLGPGFLCFTTL